jgi:aldehyde:ferredoxin oxidoreductase
VASPQTGIYAESYSGGSVAEFMGRAGYDAYIIRGKASSPTVLEVSDSGVTFHDAHDIWGKEVYEAQDAVQSLIGGKSGIMVIGPAFHGSSKKKIAEPSILQELYSQMNAGRKENPVIQGFKTFGTPALVSVINKIGAFPTRYWSKGTLDGWQNITAESLHKNCDVKPHACAN